MAALNLFSLLRSPSCVKCVTRVPRAAFSAASIFMQKQPHVITQSRTNFPIMEAYAARRFYHQSSSKLNSHAQIQERNSDKNVDVQVKKRTQRKRRPVVDQEEGVGTETGKPVRHEQCTVGFVSN